jgi:hypothetical protein
MAFKQQSNVSPLKRIRRARGLSLVEISVLSGVSYGCVKKIDRLQATGEFAVGGIGVGKVMRVAMLLECAPSDLLPFLAVRCKPDPSVQKIARSVKNRKPRRSD